MDETEYQIMPDSKLWNSFLEGDNKALHVIYETYVQMLYCYGLNFTRDENLVKDCIHDVFVDLFKYRKNLRETNNIQLYLFKSLKNAILKAISKSRKYLGVDQMDDSFLFEKSVEEVKIEDDDDLYRTKMVRKAFSTLTSRQKEVLFMKFYSNLGYDEISKILNMNYQSARNLVHRSIDKLRESYSKNGIVLFIFPFRSSR